jgi:hypothetical protein
MDTNVSDAERNTVDTDLALRRLQLRRIDGERGQAWYIA